MVRYHNLFVATRSAVFPGFIALQSRTEAIYAHEANADDADADHGCDSLEAMRRGSEGILRNGHGVPKKKDLSGAHARQVWVDTACSAIKRRFPGFGGRS